MKLAGTDFEYLTGGAYGLIFIDPKRGRICKVFRSNHEEEHSRLVFAAEVSAYRIAMQTPELAVLVPRFHGVCEEVKIIDSTGHDITQQCYPDLAYEIDFVPGYLQKIGTAPSAEQERIRLLFKNRGINHTIDSSVVLDKHTIIKIIDFATEEFEQHW